MIRREISTRPLPNFAKVWFPHDRFWASLLSRHRPHVGPACKKSGLKQCGTLRDGRGGGQARLSPLRGRPNAMLGQARGRDGGRWDAPIFHLIRDWPTYTLT